MLDPHSLQEFPMGLNYCVLRRYRDHNICYDSGRHCSSHSKGWKLTRHLGRGCHIEQLSGCQWCLLDSCLLKDTPLNGQSVQCKKNFAAVLKRKNILVLRQVKDQFESFDEFLSHFIYIFLVSVSEYGSFIGRLYRYEGNITYKGAQLASMWCH